jgi:hypothetical protein
MSQIKETTLRFNLKREEDRKAWTYLQSRDPKQYKSYSRTAILAINDFFDRKAKLADDPYLETREKEDSFLQQIKQTIEDALAKQASLGTLGGLLQLLKQPASKSEPENTAEDIAAALDFVDSF